VRRASVNALVGFAILLLAAGVVAGGLLTAPQTPSALAADPSTPVGAPQQDANRGEAVSRGQARPVMDGVKGQRSLYEQRAGMLETQQRAIAARRDQLAKEQARAAKQREAQRQKAAAAARAHQKLVARLGYDPGTTNPRSIARQLLKNKFGYGANQYSCFNNIIMRESMWNIHATNSGSGAYGIPQALPGSKMASAGPDWRNNAGTQILWGIHYMKATYGSPCGAWAFKSSHGWY
jgi:hypothetical protein